MKRKAEVILLNQLVSLNEYQKCIEKNIYPLAIKLNEDETAIFQKCKQYQNFLNVSTSFKILLDFYILTSNLDNKKAVIFYLNPYILRKKITRDEVFVNTFIDFDNQVKFVDYISESQGFDLDAPRIVFRKNLENY